MCPRMRLPDHMATLFLVFWGTSILCFSLFNCKGNNEKVKWLYWLPSDSLSDRAQLSHSGCNYPPPLPHTCLQAESQPKCFNCLVTSHSQTWDAPELTLTSGLPWIAGRTSLVLVTHTQQSGFSSARDHSDFNSPELLLGTIISNQE